MNKNMKTILKTIRKTSERGQAIILVAFSIVGLVAIVGLMIDGGILLIQYARLKRGIDAASIASASQFRKNYHGDALIKAAEEFLKFNEASANVTVFTCSCPPDDPTNCDANGWHRDLTMCAATGEPQRKLVRIFASQHVDFGFMRILGINGTTISASSIGEAASIDMVLVIDTSTSMAYETTGDPELLDPADPASGNPGDDPEVCNAHMNDGPHASDPDLLRRCEPMGVVKDAAVAFVDELFFPYDRVALVAMTGQGTSGATRNPVTVLDFNDNATSGGVATTEVQDAIRALRVFQPDRCPIPKLDNLNYVNPCLQFEPELDPVDQQHYVSQICLPRLIGVLDPTDTTYPFNTILKDALGNPVRDPSTCGPSNLGGALYEAGNQFAAARQDSFWAVIALFGGPVNAFNPLGDPDRTCPGSPGQPTWTLSGGSGSCRDEDPMPASYSPPTANWSPAAATYAQNFDWSTYDPADATRHNYTVNTIPDPDVIIYPANYDADDYARDAADYVTSPSKGQGATIYSICMGSYCKAYPNVHDPASAELLGRYLALHAGDDLSKVPVERANHGLYLYAVDSSAVGPIFEKIAENIFTRLSK
jgi:hypothetical protein